MEKTIKIDGRDVRFRSSGALPILYRSLTGREYFSDMAQNTKKLKSFSTETIEDLIWVLARCADEAVPDKMTWYDSFDEFPIFSVYTGLNELVVSSMKTTKKA